MKAILGSLAAAMLVAACSRQAEVPVAATATSSVVVPAGIAWRRVSGDADIDAAFSLARRENKPVFLYWGAKWCPPCNQVQATLFNRAEFIERTRAFVAVYVDGDRPGAQKLGARFKVVGYPTMVLFDSGGTEVMRLPGEVNPSRYAELLTLGMSARRPAKAVLADALVDAGRLGPTDWKMLAFYAWETDEQRLVSTEEKPIVLRRLASACPPAQPEAAMRLLLKALAAADAQAPTQDASTRDRVLRLLSDPAAARPHADVLTNDAVEISRALASPGTPERERVEQVYDGALRTLQADATLSRADRLMALLARVQLALARRRSDGADAAGVSRPLQDEVRVQAAQADREMTDAHERQAVIPTAAYLLREAGLLDDSDALLRANLSRSHSPYYLMSQLASNAKRRGDTAQALHWSQEAYRASEGSATRLQWGAAHVSDLVELAPQDEARIERIVAQLFDEAAAQPDTFYERSARSLQRVGRQLATWNRQGLHAMAMGRLNARLAKVCGRLPQGDAQRGVCEQVLKTP